MSGSSSVGRASAFQAGCREFESRLPLQTKVWLFLSTWRFVEAHVAQSVERFLGKEEVHRFDSGRGLHRCICHFGACLLGAAFNGFEYTA